MADQRDERNESERTAASVPSRRLWTRPVLTEYGPIGKLTQGGSGLNSDGSSGKRACL